MTEPEKRSKGTKKNARGEQSREAILSAAEQHFGEFGYRAVSTAAIADAVKISDPGLLHHFGTKEGLLMALLNRRFSMDVEKLKAGRSLSAEELGDTIRTIIKENQGKRDEVRLTMVLMGESISAHHPGHEFFQARYVRARSIFNRHVRALQKRGELSPAWDPEAIASVLVAVLDGLQFQWLLDSGVDMPAAVDAFLLILAAAFQPGESPPAASEGQASVD